MRPLSPRQQAILNRVIDTHIETAQPVGSRYITSLYMDLYQSSYSSATVRHEMGMLEELGYLMHPHTSAGRIPTDLGYRYYVDHSMSAESFPDEILEKEAEKVLTEKEEPETAAEKVSALFANLSGEMCILLLEKEGETQKPKVFVAGIKQIFNKPEFQDLEIIRKIFSVLENKNDLIEWLYPLTPEKGVKAAIGRENPSQSVQDCAVLISPCKSRGIRKGSLALVGPRRMKYSRLFPLMERMSRFIENVVDELHPEMR